LSEILRQICSGEKKIMAAADLELKTDIKGRRIVSAGEEKAEILVFRGQYGKLVGRQYI
jgi:hypothetical protein